MTAHIGVESVHNRFYNYMWTPLAPPFSFPMTLGAVPTTIALMICVWICALCLLVRAQPKQYLRLSSSQQSVAVRSSRSLPRPLRLTSASRIWSKRRRYATCKTEKITSECKLNASRTFGPARSFKGTIARLAERSKGRRVLTCKMMDSAEEALDALFEDDRLAADPEIPSHITAPRDEDGELELVRYTYVDEDTCIGCTYCADIARNTFFMEQDIKGAARVYDQGGDSFDIIEEAIDSCPVNCISYVSFEDLQTLELERIQREGSLDFNNYASFKRAHTGQSVAIPETNAEYYGSAKQGLQCDNCPSRGCKKCPMFGVGQNPVYLKRLEERQKKKEESGQAAIEEFDRAAQEGIDKIYGAEDADASGENGELLSLGDEEVDKALDVLFTGGYSFAGLDDESEEAADGPRDRDRENLQW